MCMPISENVFVQLNGFLVWDSSMMSAWIGVSMGLYVSMGIGLCMSVCIVWCAWAPACA